MANGNAETTHLHVLPLKLYLGVALGLLVMTVITVAAAQIDLGEWNIILALAIAVVKATLVALFFMHLFYDHKLYALVFIISVAFLALLIGFSMLDTERRGEVNAEEAAPIAPMAIIYDESGKPIDFSKLESGAMTGSLSEFEITNGIGPIKEKITLGPIDPALAAKGEAVFKTKCATCHKMDKRFTGPALGDVLERRTPEFVMNQILNPEKMAKAHPAGRKLVAEYMTIMTFQNVTTDDARALLEYLRTQSKTNQ
ncbi:MAG: hypothetical protein Kow0074_03670 [Candidatus Zixiibacteriota bacterium]